MQAGLATDTIHCIDAREGLARLRDGSVDCVVTSPPYWRTRDYGVAQSSWPDGSVCALGLEPDINLYMEHLCVIFDDIKRVLKPTGTMWVNLGDTYHNATKWSAKKKSPQTIAGGNNRDYWTGRCPTQGLPEKCLAQVPFRIAIAMTKRGWILRNDIIWHKPNHMPSSVKDRFTCAWEHLFLFVQQGRYFFDLDAVRVPHKSVYPERSRSGKPRVDRPSPHINGHRPCPRSGEPQSAHPLGKNPGDVWSIPTRPRPLGHYATFPEQLIERPIIVGCPKRVCVRCKMPQQTRRIFPGAAQGVPSGNGKSGGQESVEGTLKTVLGCKCRKGFEPGIVLDPFMGAGTTAVVARRLGRRFIGFELNPEYVKTANQRLAKIDRAAANNSEGREAA